MHTHTHTHRHTHTSLRSRGVLPAGGHCCVFCGVCRSESHYIAEALAESCKSRRSALVCMRACLLIVVPRGCHVCSAPGEYGHGGGEPRCRQREGCRGTLPSRARGCVLVRVCVCRVVALLHARMHARGCAQPVQAHPTLTCARARGARQLHSSPSTLSPLLSASSSSEHCTPAVGPGARVR